MEEFLRQAVDNFPRVFSEKREESLDVFLVESQDAFHKELLGGATVGIFECIHEWVTEQIGG